MNKQKIVLLILDGWGYREESKDNAINNANKPNWDNIWQHSPHTLINASGFMVGLPLGQMGNSEVGHVNIGSGRIVNQELTRINQAIKNKSFFDNEVLIRAVDEATSQGRSVHIMGLLSAGGVHSHEEHILAMVKLSAERGAKVYVHAFLDGRDTPTHSAESSLKKIDEVLSNLGVGYIATVSGRYYSMDRDHRWDRIEKTYNAVVMANAEFTSINAENALEMAYLRNESDEFVKPTVIQKEGFKKVKIKDGDSVIFMNFRSDRSRQLALAFTKDQFNGFARQFLPKVNFVTLSKYTDDIQASVAYAPEKLRNVLGQVLADNNMTQLRIAETEKYAHVTFFFNGGQERPFKGEDRILVSSPKVATYDLKPEMSAYEVTDKLVSAIKLQQHDVIICNYANPDMVGHTGNYDATVKSIEALDKCLGRVSETVREIHGDLFITADHGNADQMVDPETGKIHTAHTTNKVPFVYQGERKSEVVLSNGKLSDIAPTILAAIGVNQPREMTGKPILKFE